MRVSRRGSEGAEASVIEESRWGGMVDKRRPAQLDREI
jgi:hypothetical protein